MKFCKIFLVWIISVFPVSVFAADVYVELDQMLCVKIGLEQEFSPRWGIKGSLGISPLGITVIPYDLSGFYRIIYDENRPFRLTSEFGLNVAYFDVFEGNVVDWDPHIDDPYAGFIPGINLNWGYAFKRGVLGLKTGILYMMEYQRDSGWRDPILLPEITLEYRFPVTE